MAAKEYGIRLRILYILKMLMERSDEDHDISVDEMRAELKLLGIIVSRRAIYADIEALKHFGVDILMTRGKKFGYYVASREFELPELKLLADAVSSAKFLTGKKSSELIDKLKRLAAPRERDEINRNLYVADRVKSSNERIYLNVDTISKAISLKQKIRFRYFSYDVNKRKVYRDTERTVSPVALTWSEERYYLVARYEKYPDTLTNFRVDRMDSVEILTEPAEKPPAGFSLPKYMRATFSMFSGETESVTLRFDNSLVNAVLDRFGTGVKLTRDGDDHFLVTVDVKAEPPFFGWLFKFGEKVEIRSPAALREKYREALLAAAEKNK